MMRTLLLLICLTATQADEFPVVVGSTAHTMMPELSERVLKALQQQGLDATLSVVPGDRALHHLQHGIAALDIVRHPSVMSEESPLYLIKPAVVDVTMIRIVPADAKENCNRTDDDLNVIGVRGIRSFETVIAPYVETITWADDEMIALKMLASGRGDASYWLHSRLSDVETQYANTLSICEDRTISLQLFSYLHEDYDWAREQVEAAYQTLFATPN